MRLLAVRAVPTPLLALDVHRAGEPGAPGGSAVSPFAIVLRLLTVRKSRAFSSHASSEGPLDRRPSKCDAAQQCISGVFNRTQPAAPLTQKCNKSVAQLSSPE